MTPDPDPPIVEVFTPGDEAFRLVTRMTVTTGKSIRLDGDEEQNDEIICVVVDTRSLASAEETEHRELAVHYDAARWLRDELTVLLHQAGQE